MRWWHLVLLLPLASAALRCGDDGPAEPEPPDCATLAACREQGACSASGGQCLALSDDDCQSRSEVCASKGLCTARQGVCSATADAQCQAASVCTIYGGCHARDGRCIATSDEDCAASSGCALYGWCSATLQGECVKILP